MVAASAARGSWKRAVIAALAAAVTLVPIGFGLYFLFRFVGGSYLDYIIAGIIFMLGINEVREGLSERSNSGKKNKDKGIATGWKAVWPAYVGGVLEGGEALLYTFAVGHGSGNWIAAIVGGGIGFVLPWAGLRWLRSWINRLPEWKVELWIGIILMSAATVFGTLHALGVLKA